MAYADMMDEELAALEMVNLLNEVYDDAEVERRFHVRENPFEELTETQFIKLYRLTKECANQVIQRVTPHIVCGVRSCALDIRTKVLCALTFFAAGSYQTDVGQGRNAAMAQSTVSKCVAEVSDALNHPDVFNEYVKFPRNLNKMCDVRNRIFERHGFPGCVGMIDCTHVAIHAPPKEGEYPEVAYVNRRGYHSVNVQLICDADLKILNVNALHPESSNDAYIWNNSAVKTRLENLPDDQTFYLLGDSGYPLRIYLQTPLANPEPGPPEERYNSRLLSTRATIERCNGVLKGRFRCLLKDRTALQSRKSVKNYQRVCCSPQYLH